MDFSKTQKLSFFEGIAYNAAFMLTQGFIITGLAFQFNVTERVLAIIGVIPMISQMLQVFSPKLLKISGSRKRAMLISASIARYSFTVIPLFLLLNLKNQYLLLASLLIFGAFNSLTGNFWISIMKDIIPEERSGKFFGLRNLLISLSSMVLLFFYSLLIDILGESKGFLLVAVLGALSAVISRLILGKYEDPPKKTFITGSIFTEALRDDRFKKFLTFALFWNFTIALASPFFSYHQIVNLKLNYSYLSILGFIATGVSMFFYFLWGKLADKIGHQSVAEFSLFTASILASMWIFMNEHTFKYLLLVDSVVGGIAWSGINLTLFTLLLGIADSSKVEAYFAVFSFASGMGALFGALTGGFLAGWLNLLKLEIGGMTIYGIQFLFLTGGILRGISWLLLKRVKTRKKVSVPRYFFYTVSVLSRRAASRPYEYASMIIRISQILKKRKPRRSARVERKNQSYVL
ncbi:MFS transporter [Kosmotoga pacifica]|uniref:MFS transporter n=1 Tax=Kosmotoga pacifica TaxID=1330330 RepID=A0A0G2ZBQ5_9BACT|nr:MFS transporter [Kosmotoga pacifica]AKI97506.1 MFS transporter [Kosmotoga pacifica]